MFNTKKLKIMKYNIKINKKSHKSFSTFDISEGGVIL